MSAEFIVPGSICAGCGEVLTFEDIGWPGEGHDDLLCQICWEKHCGETLWQYIGAVEWIILGEEEDALWEHRYGGAPCVG